MTDPTEALARALARYAQRNPDRKAYRYTTQAERILADPAPLLAALAESGVLEVDEYAEPCEGRCHVWSHYAGSTCGDNCRLSADHAGAHECVDGHTFERGRGEVPSVRDRRYVSEWRPVNVPVGDSAQGVAL